MDPIQNNPFALRIANAYGAGPARAVYPVEPVRPVSPVSAGADRVADGSFGAGRIGTDTVELSSNVAARQRIASLVAARVPGTIDFTVADGGILAPGEAGALQLHRRPADLNAAATGVSVGRSLDLQA
ncbi:MAG: hypothetical protein IT436_05790 [Phycisphaerales bacterium]|nr:hypothetical protein [Phycisphaerales bacterium]